MTGSMGILQIRGLSRTFHTAAQGTTVALQATDLDVEENDFVTILGPSGCGKDAPLYAWTPIRGPARASRVTPGK